MKSQVFSFYIVLLVSVGALAQGTVASSQTGYFPLDSFSAGMKVENFNYNEPSMNTQGLLYGVDGRYEHLLSEGSLPQSLVLHFELLTGKSDYIGSTWSGTPLKASNQFEVYQVDAQYHLPRLWKFAGAYWTPLTGLGLRGTAQDKESAGDYRREYYYFYASAGLQLQYFMRRGSRFCLSGQGDFLVEGYNNTHLSDASADMPDVTLNFISGSAYHLEAEYDFHLNDAHEVQVVLSYAVWSLQASHAQDIGGGNMVYEPVNQTFLTGLNVGYLF